MTKTQLKEELKQSMLARDTERTSTLRMVISALGYYEIEKGGAGYEATEEDVEAVLQKQAKQRRDSIEQYKVGNRPELAEKEAKELELLESFLPKQMSEEEVKKLVDDAVASTGATSAADMGKVMSALMPQTKGKADGGLVSRLVKEKLGN
ncbi:MAG TPA: GatB/YqeY domain-containing protein [Candidatus Saccharimonadales bacterium]|nr:GatB/YqeY domain-containing protein [Candidatus Saccharimonadales bacterium]